MFNDKFIYEKTIPVEEEELNDAITFGEQMYRFARKKKFLLLTANQVGDNRAICVVKDDDLPQKYGIFVNPIIEEEIENDGASSHSLNFRSGPVDYPIKLESFKRKRVMVPILPKVSVSVYSVHGKDRVEFIPTGELSIVWQTADYCLNGVGRDRIVESDYMTIRNSK